LFRFCSLVIEVAGSYSRFPHLCKNIFCPCNTRSYFCLLQRQMFKKKRERSTGNALLLDDMVAQSAAMPNFCDHRDAKLANLVGYQALTICLSGCQTAVPCMLPKCPSSFVHIEILGFRMGEHHCRHRCFRVHHETFRQVDADIFRLHQLEQRLLHFQIRTSRIAE